MRKGVVMGSYIIDQPLGAGGMGRVYRARNLHATGVTVAIKTPADNRNNGELRLRLRAEYELVARLDHPNIVRVLHYEEGESGTFLVTEYLEGASLHAWRRTFVQGTPIDLEELLRIFRDVLSAVAYLHRMDIIHRDLSTSNIFLVGAGCAVKVIDFGNAIERKGAVAITRRTLDEGGFRNSDFSAPEILRGEEEGSSRTDVFALGVMLYELLSGQQRGGRHVSELENDLASLPQIPRGLIDAFVQATSERGMRFRDASEFLTFLEELPRDRKATTRAVNDDTVPSWLNSITSRRTLRRIASAGALLALVAVLLLGLSGDRAVAPARVQTVRGWNLSTWSDRSSSSATRGANRDQVIDFQPLTTAESPSTGSPSTLPVSGISSNTVASVSAPSKPTSPPPLMPDLAKNHHQKKQVRSASVSSDRANATRPRKKPPVLVAGTAKNEPLPSHRDVPTIPEISVPPKLPVRDTPGARKSNSARSPRAPLTPPPIS